MSSLEEINRDYSNYTSIEKLFAYTSYGVQIGAAVIGVSTAFMVTSMALPCYTKGSLQNTELVSCAGVFIIAGTFIGGAVGAATGTVIGAVFLANDLVHNDYDLT